MPGLKCLSGHIEPAGELDGGRPDRLVLMDMLVRIEVGRIATDQPAKVAQLTLQLLGNDREIVERNDLGRPGPRPRRRRPIRRDRGGGPDSIGDARGYRRRRKRRRA